mmetsp:Transcript_52487/g.122067  ORF Transcript_52487/g.122067 Transcript_52487/m.122067 type:complete len:274 (+) Transcript_52487:2910-3731(+)
MSDLPPRLIAESKSSVIWVSMEERALSTRAMSVRDGAIHSGAIPSKQEIRLLFSLPVLTSDSKDLSFSGNNSDALSLPIFCTTGSNNSQGSSVGLVSSEHTLSRSTATFRITSNFLTSKEIRAPSSSNIFSRSTLLHCRKPGTSAGTSAMLTWISFRIERTLSEESGSISGCTTLRIRISASWKREVPSSFRHSLCFASTRAQAFSTPADSSSLASCRRLRTATKSFRLKSLMSSIPTRSCSTLLARSFTRLASLPVDIMCSAWSSVIDSSSS